MLAVSDCIATRLVRNSSKRFTATVRNLMAISSVLIRKGENEDEVIFFSF